MCVCVCVSSSACVCLQICFVFSSVLLWAAIEVQLQHKLTAVHESSCASTFTFLFEGVLVSLPFFSLYAHLYRRMVRTQSTHWQCNLVICITWYCNTGICPPLPVVLRVRRSCQTQVIVFTLNSGFYFQIGLLQYCKTQFQSHPHGPTSPFWGVVCPVSFGGWGEVVIQSSRWLSKWSVFRCTHFFPITFS